MSTGTVFDIKKFAIHDGPGIRTTVFFKGCTMDCIWCHNPESRTQEPESFTIHNDNGNKDKIKVIGREVTADQIIEEIRKDEVFYDESCGGVTFSGGEPLVQVSFLKELLQLCKQNGYHTTVDTCGNVPWESYERVNNLVDLYLYDLKIMDNIQHREKTTVLNDMILENIKRLAQTSIPVRIRLPLVEGITATDENITAMIAFLKPIPELRTVDLLPYNMFGQDKIRRYGLNRPLLNVQPVGDERIEEIKTEFESAGFEVHIGG